MGHSADRALVKCHYVQHRSPMTILESASGAPPPPSIGSSLVLECSSSLQALCNVSRLQQGATTVPRSVRLTSTSAAVTYLSLLPTVWSDQYLCIVMLRPTPDPPDTLFSHITAVLKTTLNIYRLGTLLHWTILNSPPTVLPPRHPLYLPLPSPFPMPL